MNKLFLPLVFMITSAVFLSACTKKTPEALLEYPKKNPIVEFDLLKQDGSEFNQESLKGSWNLLFMGFTNCPDVCPTTLRDLSNVYEQLDPQVQKALQVIFLSVDPERDSLEHIGEYIAHFNKDFIGVTGDNVELGKLSKSIGGIYYLNKEEGEFYSVDHSARIFIVNPQGERYGIVKSDVMHAADKSSLVESLSQLVDD